MTIIDEKVREKIAQIARDFFSPKISEWRRNGVAVCILPADELAAAILQSPDLRVTLVEPQYKVWRSINSPDPHVVDNRHGGTICVFYESAGYAEENAKHLVDWLNSKEPK